MRSESWKCYAVFVAFSSSTCRLILVIVDYGIFNMATSCVNVFNPVLSKPKATRKRKAQKTKNYIKKYIPPYYVLKFNGKSVFYAKLCGATFTINAASPRLIHSTIAPVMCGTTCTVLPKYFPSRSWCFCRDNSSLETTVGTLQPAAVLLDD